MLKLDLSVALESLPHKLVGQPAGRPGRAPHHAGERNRPGGEFTGWVHLPRDYDRAEFARIKAAAADIRRDSDALLVIGIGGSYLGARAVLELLRSPNHNLHPDRLQVFFAGNTLSSDAVSELAALLENKDFPSTSFPNPAPPPNLPSPSACSSSCLNGNTAGRVHAGVFTSPPTRRAAL
jgi:glucose-6-phosphate isomerase